MRKTLAKLQRRSISCSGVFGCDLHFDLILNSTENADQEGYDDGHKNYNCWIANVAIRLCGLCTKNKKSLISPTKEYGLFRLVTCLHEQSCTIHCHTLFSKKCWDIPIWRISISLSFIFGQCIHLLQRLLHNSNWYGMNDLVMCIINLLLVWKRWSLQSASTVQHCAPTSTSAWRWQHLQDPHFAF